MEPKNNNDNEKCPQKKLRHSREQRSLYNQIINFRRTERCCGASRRLNATHYTYIYKPNKTAVAAPRGVLMQLTTKTIKKRIAAAPHGDSCCITMNWSCIEATMRG